MVTNAPVVLTICADFRRVTDWCECRRAIPGYDNLLSFMNAATDALLYTQTFCNLAEEEGLGICYLGTTLYSSAQIAECLHLPALTFPVATLTVGWPAEDPDLQDRLPLSSFVHQESYQPYTPELIDQYYSAKESLPANQGFVTENGKEKPEKERIALSEPYLTNELILVTRADSKGSSVSRLKGATVMLDTDARYMTALQADESLLNRFGQVERVTGGAQQCFDSLNAGECSAIVTDSVALAYYTH